MTVGEGYCGTLPPMASCEGGVAATFMALGGGRPRWDTSLPQRDESRGYDFFRSIILMHLGPTPRNRDACVWQTRCQED